MIFWERFYQLCISNNTKPNPVAKNIGIGSATLSNWKSGDTAPNSEALIKIAKHFNCSVDYLLGLTNFMESPKNEFSVQDLNVLEKIHLLSTDGKTNAIKYIDYLLFEEEKKRKETLSPSADAEDDARLA